MSLALSYFSCLILQIGICYSCGYLPIEANELEVLYIHRIYYFHITKYCGCLHLVLGNSQH